MRVAVVVGICVQRDAISAAATSQVEALAGLTGVTSVDLFTTHLDREVGCPVHVVPNGWHLANHPAIRAADVVIVHWGIVTPLFDALWLLDHGRQRVAVHFHNVTPPHLVAPADRWVIEESLSQIEAVGALPVELWTYSEFNRATLVALGVDPERIRFVPFAVELPAAPRPPRPPGAVRLACVGRLVPAKAVHVVIEAVARCRDDGLDVSLVVAGNASLSEATYGRRLHELVDELQLDGVVRFSQPDDDELLDLLRRTDIMVSPSLHEGFCVPVVEAYLAGCHAIGTTEGNLPWVVQAPDPVVPPEDPTALAAAIGAVARDLDAPADPAWLGRVAQLAGRYSGPAVSAALHRALFAPSVDHAWPEMPAVAAQ